MAIPQSLLHSLCHRSIFTAAQESNFWWEIGFCCDTTDVSSRTMLTISEEDVMGHTLLVICIYTYKCIGLYVYIWIRSGIAIGSRYIIWYLYSYYVCYYSHTWSSGFRPSRGISSTIYTNAWLSTSWEIFRTLASVVPRLSNTMLSVSCLSRHVYRKQFFFSTEWIQEGLKFRTRYWMYISQRR